MKTFLDEFTLYNDMDSHLKKFRLCFQKCKEYGISLNLNKCAFMVFLGMILRVYCFQIREITRSKENASNNNHATTIHNRFKYSMGWHNSTNVLSKKLLL
jgi:hypothetical protein